MKNHLEILEASMKVVIKKKKTINLKQEIKINIDKIIENAEHRKGVFTVFLTSLVHKIYDKSQDIRMHQSNLEGGYSGRSIDTKYITPFMKKYRFPGAMGESGWLTRSLEQNIPYDLNYKGKISPQVLKDSFLLGIDYINKNPKECSKILDYVLKNLLELKELKSIEINPVNNASTYTINDVISMLVEHMERSNTVGTARFPVLALYSVYQALFPEIKRFQGKLLKDLGSHTSADLRSGDIGDIQVNTEDGIPFEAIEVKYGKPITADMVIDAYNKLQKYPLKRYYLLSTVKSRGDEVEKINKEIKQISKKHGCQIIVNGVIDTIKYYLRLLESYEYFLSLYGDNLEKDAVIKAEQKKLWNEIIGS